MLGAQELLELPTLDLIVGPGHPRVVIVLRPDAGDPAESEPEFDVYVVDPLRPFDALAFPTEGWQVSRTAIISIAHSLGERLQARTDLPDGIRAHTKDLLNPEGRYTYANLRIWKHHEDTLIPIFTQLLEELFPERTPETDAIIEAAWISILAMPRPESEEDEVTQEIVRR